MSNRALLVMTMLFLPLSVLTCILTCHAWLPSANGTDPEETAAPISDNTPEQQGKVRVQLHNSKEGCRLDESRIEFLDCGHDGDVYTAPLMGDCGIARGGAKVAIEFSTTFLDGFRQKRYLRTNRDDGKWLHRTLVTNTTSEAETQRIMRHFIVPFATANFPRPVLETMKNQSETLCYQNAKVTLESVDDSKDSEQAFLAKVTLFASGQNGMDMMGHMTRDLQHRAIKDLVYVFRLMYDRGLLHNDVSLAHVIVGRDNITSLIDYDRSKVAKDAEGWEPSFDEHIRREQWDLLALIGNICYNKKGHVEFEIPPKPTPDEMNEIMARLEPVLNECGFESNNVVAGTEKCYSAITLP